MAKARVGKEGGKRYAVRKILTCSRMPEWWESQAFLDHDLHTSRVNFLMQLLVEMKKIKLLPKRLWLMSIDLWCLNDLILFVDIYYLAFIDQKGKEKNAWLLSRIREHCGLQKIWNSVETNQALGNISRFSCQFFFFFFEKKQITMKQALCSLKINFLLLE